MKSDRVGATLLRASLVAHQVKLDELAHALGNTPSAHDTARLGLFFGPTVVGYRNFVEAISLDLERALLGGHETRWIRAFEAGESVLAEMKMVEYQEKNGMEIGVFETIFSTPGGQPIQVQRTTFIERAIKTKGAVA